MKISRHATIRSQQRGIPSSVIEIIIDCGTWIRKPGNAREYILTKKAKRRVIEQLKKIIQLLDKTNNKAILVSLDEENIITVYPKK